MEIRQINQDSVDILFNPLKENLEPGESLKIMEKGDGKRGLVVQVIELRTIDYRSLIEEQLREVTVEQFQRENYVVEEDLGMLDMKNLKLAVAKIRKEILVEKKEIWKDWDGWIPTRNVDIVKISSRDLMKNVVEEDPFPLELGETEEGTVVKIRGRNLDQVNVVTSVKGAGKSHLAKVILLELIEKGAQCIVFDVNKEYSQLSPLSGIGEKKIISLRLGEDLKINVVDYGVGKLCDLLESFEYTPKSIAAFYTYFKDIFKSASGRGEFVPFISLKEELKNAGEIHESHRQALQRAIDQIDSLGIFANTVLEFSSLEENLKSIDKGGAIILDISLLSNHNRKVIMPAMIESIKDLMKKGARPFLFFEEAHIYLMPEHLLDLVTRIRHYGSNTFFITNAITRLPEVILRQLDNLFLLKLPHERDIAHICASTPIDDDTIKSFAKKIPFQECVLIGKATNYYPLRFRPKTIKNVSLAGETKSFFKDEESKNNTAPTSEEPQ